MPTARRRGPHTRALLRFGRRGAAAEHARLSDGGSEILEVGIRSLLSEMLAAVDRSVPGRPDVVGDPADLADLLLALARGLEPELGQPERVRHLLDQGVRLLAAARKL